MKDELNPLLGVMPGEVELRVTVIPSFQREWSLGISSNKERYFVTHIIFQRSLWANSLVQSGPTTWSYDFSSPRIRTTARTARISTELHRLLRAEWDRSIETAQQAEGIGLDGTTFKFRSMDRSGSAWSPDAETRNGKLVDIVTALAVLADSGADTSQGAGEQAVLRNLKELPPP